MRLIDADALMDDVMKRYCKDCDKRKGIKSGKRRIIYEIGDAPCRACSVDDMKAELENAPTIDAVPRQKYEEDMENAFAHGYTDAESKYRKMIEGGELVEVVRCKDCKHKVTTEDGEYNPRDIVCDYWESDGLEETDFCSYGERRTE